MTTADLIGEVRDAGGQIRGGRCRLVAERTPPIARRPVE
jgi:hypothetical protein